MDATAPIPMMPSPLSTGPFDLGGTLASGRKPSLREAAGDMENMFLSMLLKEMRQSLGSEEDGLFAGDSGDVYGGLFDFYLGKHLADAGGVGLASTWAAQLEKPSRPEQAHDAGPASILPRPTRPGRSGPS